MAILSIPDQHQVIHDPKAIGEFLSAHGVFFDQWSCDVFFKDTASQEEILSAYTRDLKPFMDEGGYLTADVISINSLTENYPAAPVFNVLCQKGDLISVPAGTKHWFDAGVDSPFVKAIRIFIDQTGWIPAYTESGIEKKYQ